MSPSAVTIVVPTFQRRDSVLRLLRSLESQTVPPGTFDVVVTVDGSTDGTAAAPGPATAESAPHRAIC